MSEQVELKACHRCKSVDKLMWIGGAVSCANDGCYADAESVEIWNTRPIEDALQAQINIATIGYNGLAEHSNKLQAKLDRALKVLETILDTLHKDDSLNPFLSIAICAAVQRTIKELDPTDAPQ